MLPLNLSLTGGIKAENGPEMVLFNPQIAARTLIWRKSSVYVVVIG